MWDTHWSRTSHKRSHFDTCWRLTVAVRCIGTVLKHMRDSKSILSRKPTWQKAKITRTLAFLRPFYPSVRFFVGPWVFGCRMWFTVESTTVSLREISPTFAACFRLLRFVVRSVALARGLNNCASRSLMRLFSKHLPRATAATWTTSVKR